MFSVLSFSSCSSDDNKNINTVTSLEGDLLLQNIWSGTKLTFTGNNFIINSGTVTINGTFKLINNLMSGQVVNREGALKEVLEKKSKVKI